MRLTTALHYATIRHHNSRFLDRGLFGGARIRFADRISPFGNRSRRKLELNMHWSSLYSQILGKAVRVKVTTTVLKRVDALGGLDNYILGQRVLEGQKAEWLKKALVVKQWQQELQEKGIPFAYTFKEPIKI